MYLKSPDPDAYVVVHETGRYPVRGGVFHVPAELRDRFPGFAETDEVDGDAASELARLGVLPLDEETTAAPSEPEVVEEQEQAEESEAVESIELAAEDESAEDEPQDAPDADAVPAEEPAAEEKPARKPRNRKK